MAPKKVLVTLPLMPDFDKYVEKIRGIWDRRWMTNNGELYCELQNKLGEYFETRHLELYVNGHMALDVAIRAYGLKGEVITTPFTFASTTHALVVNGIKPVFCDIKANDYTIDEDKIEALITPQTTAIMPVHVYGCPCNTKRIQQIADKHGLKVIYDAAHAFGVKVGGKPLVLEGDCSMLSFHATKVFNTIEGGALIFKDGAYTRALRILKNFGIEDAETVSAVGQNAKMNEFAAAMGLCNLELVEDAMRRRKNLVDIYREKLSDVPGLRLLDYEGMEAAGIAYNYAYMPVQIDESKLGASRNEVFDKLAESDIYARKYFFPLIVDYDCYRSEYGGVKLPVARQAANEVLTLPLSADTTQEDVVRVCEAIRNIARRA